MFGLFKKIFKKQGTVGSVIAPVSPSAPAYSRTATPGQPDRPASNPFSGGRAGAAPAAPAPMSAARTKTPTAKPTVTASAGKNPHAVTLSLDEIVPGLTHEFQSLFEVRDNAEVSFPLQAILPQLSTGRIRISFGDLRNACPNGSCNAGPEHDAKLVDLPLAKILSRVNPAFLPRKTQRAAMNVPDDVTGLFGTLGEPHPSVAPATRTPQPVAPVKPPSAAAPSMPPPALPKQNGNRKAAITAADLGNIPSLFNFQKPAAEEEVPAVIQPAALEPEVNPAPAAVPVLEDIPKIKFNLSPPAPAPVAVDPVATVIPRASAAAPEPAAAAPASQDDNVILLPVAQVQNDWSDSVQDEIKQYDLGDSHFSLPYGEVDLAMRKGKIVFPWKTLRSWITPAGSAPKSTACDNEEMTLPLKMVAPLFLKQRQPRSKQRKVSIEEEIPDLFSGGPGDEPEAAPAKPVAAAPAPAAPKATAPAAPAPARNGAAMPKISASNPAELVKRTAGMPGVTGSLVAMNDGLLVASELPKPLIGETVAAFLPQIFGRLTQFSTELKLGDLTSVMLVMDNSPWIIFRTGKVYFAVVGKAGEALPLSQLTAIVADIKRQNL